MMSLVYSSNTLHVQGHSQGLHLIKVRPLSSHVLFLGDSTDPCTGGHMLCLQVVVWPVVSVICHLFAQENALTQVSLLRHSSFQTDPTNPLSSRRRLAHVPSVLQLPCHIPSQAIQECDYDAVWARCLADMPSVLLSLNLNRSPGHQGPRRPWAQVPGHDAPHQCKRTTRHTGEAHSCTLPHLRSTRYHDMADAHVLNRGFG